MEVYSVFIRLEDLFNSKKDSFVPIHPGIVGVEIKNMERLLHGKEGLCLKSETEKEQDYADKLHTHILFVKTGVSKENMSKIFEIIKQRTIMIVYHFLFGENICLIQYHEEANIQG